MINTDKPTALIGERIRDMIRDTLQEYGLKFQGITGATTPTFDHYTGRIRITIVVVNRDLSLAEVADRIEGAFANDIQLASISKDIGNAFNVGLLVDATACKHGIEEVLGLVRPTQ